MTIEGGVSAPSSPPSPGTPPIPPPETPPIPKPKKGPSRAERQEERATRILEKLFEHEDILLALMSGGAGAIAMYPIDFDTIGLQEIRTDGITADWRVTLKPHPLAQALIPNIDVGSPIPGGGTIPIHIRDWIAPPTITVVVKVPESAGPLKARLAADSAYQQVRIMFSLFGFLAGTGAMWFLRWTLGAAEKVGKFATDAMPG